MKPLNALLTLAVLAVGFQAAAYTKGQQVYVQTDRQDMSPLEAFKKTYEVIDIDGDRLTVYNRGSGTLTVTTNYVYEEKRIIEKWWYDEKDEDGNPIRKNLKMPALQKGTTVLTYTYASRQTGQPEQNQISRIFQSGEGNIALAFEGGAYTWTLAYSYVAADPKKSLRIGEVVTSKKAFQTWVDENGYMPIHEKVEEKVPTAKISAVAWKVDYGQAEAIFRLGKEWVQEDNVLSLVDSAYGLKLGDQVFTHYPDRFDLRVEQILRVNPSMSDSSHVAIFTGGEMAYLDRDVVKELLSARVCKGDGAKNDLICENYREAIKTRKENSRFTCNINGKEVKITLKEKSLRYPGAKVSEGRQVTADIFEWTAILPAQDVSEKGSTAQARVRYDLNKYNALTFQVGKKRGETHTYDCMPDEKQN